MKCWFRFATQILFILGILASRPLHSQQYYFANYSVDDGLPHSQVNFALQADDGYLWLATNMGVARFDGNEFRSFTTKDGLGDNKVRVIFQASRGNLLFGHDNGTLTWWDGTRFENLQINPETRRILCIYRDRNQNVWIGTEGTGVFRFHADNLLPELRKMLGRRFDYSAGLSRDVLGMAQTKSGDYLFITDLGLKRMDARSGRFDFYKPKGLDVVQFSSILVDEKDALWLGTVKEGLYCFKGGQGDFIRYDTVSRKLRSNFVTCLRLNESGGVIAGTWGGGLSIISDVNTMILTEENGLAEDKIRCILEDTEGNIWAGTNQNGISCFRGARFEVYFRSRGGTNTQINAIFGDAKGDMWFGANNRVMRMTEPGRKVQTIELGYVGRDAEVTSIIEDKKGRIWISTWGSGVFFRERDQSEINRFTGRIPANSDITFNENFVYAMHSDRQGRIWFSMLQGLAVYNPVENSVKTYTRRDGLPENSITDIQEDSLGRLWIGTSGRGLCILDKGHFTPVRTTDIRINPSISSLSMDANGKIWIATEGGGIYSFDGRKYTSYTVSDGIPSNYVSFIEADRLGSVWLGTHKGICQFDPIRKTALVYDKTDKHARVEARPNAVYLDREDFIWAGTINGVLRINTRKARHNTRESITHLTAVKIFEDTLRQEGVRLHFRQNYLSFYFKGLCFSDPEKVRYQYKLEGADQNWQTVSQDFAIYNNLDPGRYVFMVRSCNDQGLWNKTPVTFRFEITPPFWMTWWFYTACALILVASVFLFVKFRERNLRNEKKHLEQVVETRTKEIVRQKEEIESQRDELQEVSEIIEQKNRSITDSIRYARRIQMATLPYHDVIFRSLTDAFILFRPKDIVSGDFYAFARKESKIIFAVADCTGHGVPGAFMSMIGTNLFNQVINEKGITEPAEILNQLDIGVERALKQEETDNHDGMDIVICSLDFNSGTFEYAGANRPLWILHRRTLDLIYPDGPSPRSEFFGENMLIIKPDKVPIGGFHLSVRNKFTNHRFAFEPGDCLFMFSDGYADQFGGEAGKKLLSKRFREYLISIKDKPMMVQEKLLDTYFEEWKGSREQVDDVLVVGVRHPGALPETSSV